jgi:hypothetical protein
MATKENLPPWMIWDLERLRREQEVQRPQIQLPAPPPPEPKEKR